MKAAAQGTAARKCEQIAAASLGYKPLFWDPWGAAASALVRAQLRAALPSRTGSKFWRNKSAACVKNRERPDGEHRFR